ncbi:MAG TPA: cyclic pyranopterin monophosphate synthase MoaC, partial [Planctomycetaceae bacterium]|nr:cyclic pyranopterin monophosphate synthase MoaC [Planctomycetaceae bacterium]
AVAAALMTLYDMAKSIDREMVISDIQLDTKTGGSRGNYVRSDGAAAPSE